MIKNLDFNTPLGLPVMGRPFKLIFGIDDMAAATIGTGIIGGVANLFGQGQQNKATKEQMALQHEYNKDEMAYSQSLNREYQEWLNNTQYGAQVSGMKNAGLNPSGASSSVGAMQASNALKTGSSGPAAPASRLGADMAAGAQVGYSMMDAKANVALKDSQSDLAKAEAEKIRAELPGVKANSSMAEQRAGRYSELLDKELKKMDTEISLNEEQKKTLEETQKKMQQDILESQQKVKNMKAEEAYIQMKTVMESKVMKAQEAELYAAAKAHGVTSKAAMISAMASLKNATTQANLARSQKEVNEANAALARVQAELTDKWGDAEAAAKVVGGFVGAAATAFVGTTVVAKGAGLIGKVAKVAGFHP